MKVDDEGWFTSSTVMGIQILYSLTNIVTQSSHLQSLGHQSENFNQNNIFDFNGNMRYTSLLWWK